MRGIILCTVRSTHDKILVLKIFTSQFRGYTSVTLSKIDFSAFLRVIQELYF